MSVAPRTRIRGSRNRTPNTVSSDPRTTAAQKPLAATALASSVRCAPRSREILAPEPIPIVNPTDWMIAMSENTIPTAPDALAPSFDTK